MMSKMKRLAGILFALALVLCLMQGWGGAAYAEDIFGTPPVRILKPGDVLMQETEVTTFDTEGNYYEQLRMNVYIDQSIIRIDPAAGGGDGEVTVAGKYTAYGNGYVVKKFTALTELIVDKVEAPEGMEPYRLYLSYPYPLWIGSKRATSSNAANILGNGTASYDAENRILTLNNYEYSGSGYKRGYNRQNPAAVYYEGGRPLTIVLVGDNRIKCTDGNSYGIFFNHGSTLTITGSGSLYSEGRYNGIHSRGTLIISGGSITAKSLREGIYGMGGVSVTGGKVTAEGRHGISGIETRAKLQIGPGIDSLVITGTTTVTDLPVINAVTGTGWTDVSGTEGMTGIAVSTEARSLKK